ncbi:MAG: hypothetical protein ABSA79_01030 [Candidatus Bathyarchaeia archaeon]|jgi:uncharacterized protein YihD (DUF1040 family)
MRDPKRISEVLEALKTIWEAFPDWRLGQVLENFVFLKGERGDKTSRTLFYQEDTETLAALKKAIVERVQVRTLGKEIPRGRPNDTLQDLFDDDFLSSGKPWRKPKTTKKEKKK